MVCSRFVWGIVRTINYAERRRRGTWGAMALVGGVVLPRARWDAWRGLPLVRRVTLTHPGLPGSFDGLRVVQVSDVHAGTFMPPERLFRVRRTVERLDPDLIVFTGDQLDRRDVDAEIFVHGFAGIQAPMGAFGILGNHDHVAGSELAIAALQAVGVAPLVNDAAVLSRAGEDLAVVGVDDPESSDGGGPDFSVIRRHRAAFRLLLAHQPQLWHAGADAGAEVTLAGHTHGGQIVLRRGRVSVARLGTPYVTGPYSRNGRLLYVSRGVGVGAVPIRYGVSAEIDCITLRRGALSIAN